MENAVKTCKGLLMKAKEDKKDPLLVILDWRNTPSEGFSTSPAQRLMGRCTRTLLPTAEKLLQPNSDLTTIASNLAARKRLQCKQYNRGTKNLAPLKAVDSTAHALLADGHMKSRWMDGASAETAVNCGLLWSHHQNQAARLKSLLRLRMKSDHLSYQSPCKTKTKPILPQRSKRMT